MDQTLSLEVLFIIHKLQFYLHSHKPYDTLVTMNTNEMRIINS